MEFFKRKKATRERAHTPRKTKWTCDVCVTCVWRVRVCVSKKWKSNDCLSSSTTHFSTFFLRFPKCLIQHVLLLLLLLLSSSSSWLCRELRLKSQPSSQQPAAETKTEAHKRSISVFLRLFFIRWPSWSWSSQLCFPDFLGDSFFLCLSLLLLNPKPNATDTNRTKTKTHSTERTRRTNIKLF